MNFTDRASGPTQEHAYVRGPRITALETLVPTGIMPGLLLLRVHTDAGTAGGEQVIGHGETYYLPQAAAAVIHDWMAPRLLGADATAIESHWRFLYERMTAFGGTASAEADLADSLDALARSVSSGAVTPPVDAGATAAADGATMAASAFDPAWLSAGALARSAHQEPLPPVFRCPACRKPQAYGHRFCGYCGEPLDKAIA